MTGRMPLWYGPDEAAAVPSEYAAARESAAVVDLAERGVLDVTGPQRQPFLHNLLSNDLRDREPGQGCRAALMDVKGHLLALMRALVMKDAVRLELPADRLALVEAALQHYRVGAPVRFAARSDAVLGLLGPQARDCLRQAGTALPELAPEAHVTLALGGHNVTMARAGDLPCGGIALHAPAEAAADVWSVLVAAGARPIGRRALDALRVEAGRPWYGYDVSEQNLLHETGLLREYHSSSKGCYIGQEVIARLEARGGNVNKALRALRLTAAASPGSMVSAADREVGRLTTAAVSPRLGPVALAYVHRSHFEPGTSVAVEGHPATVAGLTLDGHAEGGGPTTTL
jgi:folate-binding protein YgfZ